MRKNHRATKSRFQHTQRVALPPGGPAPNKSMQLDLELPNRAATPQIATEKIENGVVELADGAADTPTNKSQPNGELADSAADTPANNPPPDGELADSAADTPVNNPPSNGDEVDVRMAKIHEILGYTAMPKLEKYELVAEWVRYAESKVSVFGQPVHKPQGGRPEGGVSRAARELPVPGKTFGARRKFIVRAVDIDAISPEAKVAARTAGLDDNQSALLTIAKEKTPEAQLAKIKKLADRKAAPRRKSSARDGNEHTASSAAQSDTTSDTNPRAQDAVDIPELAAVCNETSTVEAQPLTATPTSELMPSGADDVTTPNPPVAPMGDENITSVLDGFSLSVADQAVLDLLNETWDRASDLVRAQFRARIGA